MKVKAHYDAIKSKSVYPVKMQSDFRAKVFIKNKTR